MGHRAVLVVALACAQILARLLADLKEIDLLFASRRCYCRKHMTTKAKQTRRMVASRPTEVARAGAALRGPVHGRPRHRDRERRAAVDPGRPRVLAGEPPVGDQRLRPRLRRLPAARRPGRRHARAPPDLPRRPRRVHARLAARRPRLVGGVADRGARAPGPRRGGHLAGRAVDPVDDVRRGPRAQHRARRLGRRRRLRRRGRRAARRRPHRRAELGVDLLRQRPGRRRRASSLAPFLLHESRDADVQDVRRSRRGARDRRPRRRSSTRSPRRVRTAGSPARRSASSPSRWRCSPASSAGSCGTPSR